MGRWAQQAAPWLGPCTRCIYTGGARGGDRNSSGCTIGTAVYVCCGGADGGAFAQPASRSLPFVLTNSIASTRNAGVPPTAMTAELVLVRRPRSDRGWRRRDCVRAREGRHFQTNLVVRHGGTIPKQCFCGAFCDAWVVCSLGTPSRAVEIRPQVWVRGWCERSELATYDSQS